MNLLIVGALLWLAVHLGIAGTKVREALVGRLGEQGYRGVFSLLALAALLVLIFGYGRGRAETTLLWVAPAWFVAAVDAVMLAAFVLLASAVIRPRGAGEGPRGVFRITRHPLMSAVGLWSGAHLLANGDTASVIFFGSFLLTVLLGLASADAKLARRDPEKAAALHGATSRMPFAAILAGRNRLALVEIGWLAPLAGLVAWAAVLHLHQWVIGVSALPVW
jgi:uncharacterized membrane protein